MQMHIVTIYIQVEQSSPRAQDSGAEVAGNQRR